MTLDTLLGTAMLACDFHGDGDAARAAMRDDCIALPAEQRADLHAHFTQAYGVVPARAIHTEHLLSTTNQDSSMTSRKTKQLRTPARTLIPASAMQLGDAS